MSWPTILDTIGTTPLVKLQNINPNNNVDILLKLEFFNPGFSIKDRIAIHIINQAEKAGKLKPGGTIVENTSGNTGASIAMIAACRGYKAILTMPDKVSQEKQNALKAYGAEIVIAPTEAPHGSPDHYVSRAIQIAEQTPNSFRLNQYDNIENRQAHYMSTGPEIWEQTDGKVDYFIASASTGGTVSGCGKYLKEKKPSCKVIMPDPIGSAYHAFFKTGKVPEGSSCTYFVEGIGEDHITEVIDFSVVDDVVQVTDAKAFETARLLAKQEGILAGGSSGSNVWAALELAKTLTKPATIVVIIPDGGVKYLSKIYDDQWMEQNKLLKA